MSIHRYCTSLLLAFILIFIFSSAFADSLNVARISSLRMGWDNVNSVAVSGNYAYVATGVNGLSVLNIADPIIPAETGFCVLHGNALGVVVSGNYAYVAGDSAGLRIVNISNPTAPTEVSHYDTVGEAFAVAVSGQYAYVAYGRAGLRIINISNPANPILTGVYYSGNEVRDFVKIGNYGFIIDGNLRILNISNPANPTLIGSYTIGGFTTDLDVIGNYAYVMDYSYGLRIINVGIPTAPVAAGIFPVHNSWGCAIDGNYAYVGGYPYAMHVVDVSNPAAPTETGRMNLPDYVYDITISGDYAYVADGHFGLRILNVSRPTTPTFVGTFGTYDYTRDIAIDGNYAFIAEEGNRFCVVNITYPTTPFHVGYCNLPAPAYRVAVNRGYAYVALGDSGLRIINVTSPPTPTVVGLFDTVYTSVNAVAVSGNYLYAAITSINHFGEPYAGLQILNISNPARPVQNSYSPFGGFGGAAFGIAVDSMYAYVAGGYNGLQIFNITNPLIPVMTTTGWRDSINTDAYAVAVNGNYAYVLGVGIDTTILRIVDVSNRGAPLSVGRFSIPTRAESYYGSITVNGNFAYISDYITGLWIINVSNPARPTLAGFYNTPGTANGVAISGNTAYVADGYYLRLYDCSRALSVSDLSAHTLPTHFSLSNPYPNPFNAGTLIRFELPITSYVKVQVFDVMGQVVSTLANENLTAGSHQLLWNGSKAASGQYFVRLSVPNFSETKKVVLVK